MNPDLLIQGAVARKIIINVHAMVNWKPLYRGSPLWALVKDITGHGSGNSCEICRSANLDPDQQITSKLRNLDGTIA